MTLQLRPYQAEAIDALYSWFSENDGNPLVVIPTAGGKSLILSCFIREALMAYPDTRILVVTHVRELISQNYAELLGFWPEAPAGIYSAGLRKRDLKSQIIFAGIQSVHKRAYDLQKVDLVLVDEAHLIPRSSNTTYRRFIEDLRTINPYVKIVGLTATPFRLDSGMLHRGENAIFTDIAYDANIRDLIDQGYLCRPISKSAAAQIDTRNVGIRGGEFIPNQLNAVATHPETVKAVAAEIVREGVDRRGWLVFGCGILHCKMLRDEIETYGIEAKTIFGDTPSDERDATIAAFKRQDIQALVSMGVLTTGFNAKHVDLVAVARPTKSTGLWIQIVGRGTRLFDGKEDCKVLDFGGNIQRHGPVDQPKIKADYVEKAPGDAPTKKCPECGTENHIAALECEECGYEFPPIEKVLAQQASTLAILSNSAPVPRPEWLDVAAVRYTRHEKPGKIPSMCVTYQCGLAWHRSWICFEHDGFARTKAVSWWVKHAPGVAVPDTVDEAIGHANAGVIAPAKKVLVRPSGQFFEVSGISF